MIRTRAGSVAVEDIVPGDHVKTVSGDMRRVQWIGHRAIDCLRNPDPRQVWPIRIEAGAFGPRRPTRDLWLSPDHAIYAEDVLIPVRYLVNGTTITQLSVDTVGYFHLELPSHDVLIAEGLPVESYPDVGARHVFENAGPVVQLHPDFRLRPDLVSMYWEANGYAPLVVIGPALDRVRRHLEERVTKVASARLKRRRRAAVAPAGTPRSSRRA